MTLRAKHSESDRAMYIVQVVVASADATSVDDAKPNTESYVLSESIAESNAEDS